jgi:hypothetical protein
VAAPVAKNGWPEPETTGTWLTTHLVDQSETTAPIIVLPMVSSFRL